MRPPRSSTARASPRANASGLMWPPVLFQNPPYQASDPSHVPHLLARQQFDRRAEFRPLPHAALGDLDAAGRMHRLHPAGLLLLGLDPIPPRQLEQYRGAVAQHARRKRSPAAPCLATMSSGSGRDNVGITWPLLRPDAPHPGSIASTIATSTPISRRCSAVDRPVKPPPMMMTSACCGPISSGKSGPDGVATAHSELGQRTVGVFIVILSCGHLIVLVSLKRFPPDLNSAGFPKG